MEKQCGHGNSVYKYIGKFLLMALLCFVPLFMSQNVMAITFFQTDIEEYYLNEDGTTLTMVSLLPSFFKADRTEYVVPSQVEIQGVSYRVPTVQALFLGNHQKTKIIYSEGIEEIDVWCEERSEVVYPSTVSKLLNPTSLINVDKYSISKNNPYYMIKDKMLLSKDGKKLYAVLKNQETIKVPDHVTEVAPWAFKECKKMKKLIIGSGLKDFLAESFDGATKLKSIVISKKNPYLKNVKGVIYSKNGRKLIHAGTARGTLIVPKKVKKIHEGAFRGNTTVKTVFIMNSMREIPARCFYGSEIEDVVLPDTIRVIGERAFASCQKMTSIDLPKSLTTIKRDAFHGCGFAELVIPAKVKKIEKDALYTIIEELTFLGKKPPVIEKQEKSLDGKPRKSEYYDDDFSNSTYDLYLGLGKVRVPKKSKKRYDKVIKNSLQYYKFVGY